jgi:hypothetical protein
VVDRIGQVRVAWSERMGPDTGSEVPDERPGIEAQHAADLGQAGRRVGHVEPVLAGQPDRQVPGSAADLQDLCAGGATAATSAAMRSMSGPSRSRLSVS